MALTYCRKRLLLLVKKWNVYEKDSFLQDKSAYGIYGVKYIM